MIERLATAKYVYCRRRVEYLLKQSITDESLLEQAFIKVYKTPKERTQAARNAEALMRKVEKNVLIRNNI